MMANHRSSLRMCWCWAVIPDVMIRAPAQSITIFFHHRIVAAAACCLVTFFFIHTRVRRCCVVAWASTTTTKKEWKIHPQNFPFCSECNFSFFLCTSILFRWAVGKWEKWTKKREKRKITREQVHSLLVDRPSHSTHGTLCCVCVLCSKSIYFVYFASSYSLERTNNNDKLRLIDDEIVRSREQHRLTPTHNTIQRIFL